MNNIKNYLYSNNIDAWVIYNFHNNNPVFEKLMGKVFVTRKCFVIIFPKKTNIVICHQIDRSSFGEANKRYQFVTYTTWQEMKILLATYLNKNHKIIMEISQNGLLPNISFVDYGTVELIKKFVKSITSSADIFQIVYTTLNKAGIKSHTVAAKKLEKIKNLAFKYIFNQTRLAQAVTEYDIQQYILKLFEADNLITDEPPIVAIASNAANPHYTPQKEKSSIIKKNDLIVIDLWAKQKGIDSIYADITWVGYNGKNPNKIYVELFEIIKNAINSTLDFLRKELPKRNVLGYEVDDVCRNFIKKSKYGKYFIHRTGHSISAGNDVHGSGVNLDNYETHDTRKIINNIMFSIEPGIYIPGTVGIREEINVVIKNNQPIVTTKQQNKIITTK